MWTRTRLFVLLFISFFSFAFSPCVGGCSESRTYTISESELTTLQNHLSALEQNNSELLSLLNASGTDLSKASSSLTEQRNELTKLKNELTALQAETQRLSESLRTANEELQSARESFKQYEREHDRIEGRLRTQRNIWEALFAVAVGVAVAS